MSTGINISGIGPTPESVRALVDGIERVLAAGHDREERLAALTVLGGASEGGITLSGINITQGRDDEPLPHL